MVLPGFSWRSSALLNSVALIFICRWKSRPTRARIPWTISRTNRARFSSTPPYSSSRSLIAELRNWVIRYPRVSVDRGVVRHDPAADLHRDEGRDDRADAALRELQLPVDARPITTAVVVVETPRDVRAENAVLHREGAELQRLKNVGIHARLSWDGLLRNPLHARTRRYRGGRASRT